ncbi:hypothetical protein BC936DRAFT_148793, partial [Jimgerdemannia flammicorona]
RFRAVLDHRSTNPGFGRVNFKTRALTSGLDLWPVGLEVNPSDQTMGTTPPPKSSRHQHPNIRKVSNATNPLPPFPNTHCCTHS